MAVFLDADRLVHGVDEVLVRFFQCFYIDDATLGFPGHVAGVLFEDLGVPEQQCVGCLLYTSMERSTCDSAAKLTTISGLFSEKMRSTSSESQMSAFTKQKFGCLLTDFRVDRFPA